MNNLNPEERRAKADEIARLLENEPLLVDDLKNLMPYLFPDSYELSEARVKIAVLTSALNSIESILDDVR